MLLEFSTESHYFVANSTEVHWRWAKVLMRQKFFNSSLKLIIPWDFPDHKKWRPRLLPKIMRGFSRNLISPGQLLSPSFQLPVALNGTDDP